MTPLKLELSGFTCFRTKTDLDLSGLELFAIAGPTGAGKTTLLDALTYALYGQTPRLGKQGLDALISPGETQLYVTLEFRTARGLYQVTRTADRKPSGKVERNTRIFELSPEAEWRQLPESEKLREADLKLEQLVGLDYDGFTRSVLLPQGAFDEFLRGDAVKRRKLLVGLLGLDRIEGMQREAGQRAKSADARVKLLEERLAQDYAEVTPERRRALQDALKTAQDEQRQLQGRTRELEVALKELERLERLFSERARVQGELGVLNAQAEAISLKRRRLAAAQRALPIAPLVAQFERNRARAERLEGETATLLEQRKAAQARLQTAEVALEDVRRDAETHLPRLEAQLQRLAAVTPLAAQLKSRGGSLAWAERAEPGSSYSDAAWDDFQRLEARAPALKQAFVGVQSAAQTAREAEQAFLSLAAERAALSEKHDAVLAAGKAAAAQTEAAKAAFEQARIEDGAAAIRAHLHEGDTCPVCERVIERLPPKGSSDLERLRLAFERAERERDALREQFQTSRAALGAMAERLKDREAVLAHARDQQRRSEAQLEELRAAFAAEGDDPAKLELTLKARRTQLLAALARDIRRQAGGDDPEAAQQRSREDKQALEQRLRTAETTAQQGRGALAQAEALQSAQERQQTEAQDDLGSSRALLEGALGAAGFTRLEEVQAALLSAEGVAGLEAELSSYDSQKEAAERREVELSAQVAGRDFDPLHYRALQEERQRLESRATEVHQRVGGLSRDLAALEAQLERAAQLREESRQIRRTFETYRVLNQDLRGDAFQDYLLSQVQAKLARRASHILREVTAGRYDLWLEAGEYQVHDAWHASELRHAKTLSGGETFIASLALALALSDTIAGNALGALFLDEGFGTLDADTLDAVASVLESLTREGRMVGVITHVEALTARLPARLTVSKGPEGSSLSWDLA